MTTIATLFSLGWQHYLAGGLLIGAGVALRWRLMDGAQAHTTGVATWQLFVGGLLVGFGARLANGCTSGLGICDLGSLQLPSLWAVPSSSRG